MESNVVVSVSFFGFVQDIVFEPDNELLCFHKKTSKTKPSNYKILREKKIPKINIQCSLRVKIQNCIIIQGQL